MSATEWADRVLKSARFTSEARKRLKGMRDYERTYEDRDREARGDLPINWAEIDNPPKTGHGGIGPAGSVYTAEKRAKEYGFAEKVSYYQARDVDLPNEMNAQLSELSDETSLQLERVYIYSEKNPKEAPAHAGGYHKGIDERSVIGICATSTAASQNVPPMTPEQRVESAKWWRKYGADNDARDPKLGAACRRIADEEEQKAEYPFSTIRGNGARNTTVDHEFCHALIQRVTYGQSLPSSRHPSVITRLLDRKNIDRATAFGEKCRGFCQTSKISAYGAFGATMNWVPSSESICEVYSYWKQGNPVPPDIEKGLVRLEKFRPSRAVLT
jgi:hypothetical protein